MNALLRNRYTAAWGSLGKAIARPKAVLCISAHWFARAGTGVTITTARADTFTILAASPASCTRCNTPRPVTRHLASRIQQMLAPMPVTLDESWDACSILWRMVAVLCHIYFPQADVPVVQLSIDETQPPSVHYEIGRRLASLRDEGVLIVGSGNLVHNLHAYAWGRHAVEPFAWAVRFEQQAREMLLAAEHLPLIGYEKLGKDAQLAIPTPDHYLPLLYVIATRQSDDTVSFPVEGVDGGSISMLAVQVGS